MKNQEYYLKTTNNNQRLIIILPGLMTNALSEIITPLSRIKYKCDIVSLTLYDGKTKLHQDIKRIIERVNHFLAHYARRKQYKHVYIIGHSFGSSILMLSRLPKSIEKIVFWSPSPWIPKDGHRTLKSAGKYLYKLNKFHISKTLARDLAKLDIRKMVKNIRGYKLFIYFSKGDDKAVWVELFKNDILAKNVKIVNTKYPHMYNKKQLTALYQKTEQALLDID
ncbi:MAG: hypothetical protein Q7S11_01865 [bacterium]|nr:hypothetical protein [bacterium]